MRDWKVDPKLLCRKHLLGNHVELHMFVGTILRGTSLQGYIDKGLVEVHNLYTRHDEIANEMTRRGMQHNTPLKSCRIWTAGTIDVKENLEELKRRCPECKKLIEEHERNQKA